MNLYSHGVDPRLDFSDMPAICAAYERVTRMHIYERTPYAGQLVFAAFSGSHQDAIAKGMAYRKERGEHRWTCPYIPIDPHDIGRTYDADVIRINSQSGKSMCSPWPTGRERVCSITATGSAGPAWPSAPNLNDRILRLSMQRENSNY